MKLFEEAKKVISTFLWISSSKAFLTLKNSQSTQGKTISLLSFLNSLPARAFLLSPSNFYPEEWQDVSQTSKPSQLVSKSKNLPLLILPYSSFSSDLLLDRSLMTIVNHASHHIKNLQSFKLSFNEYFQSFFHPNSLLVLKNSVIEAFLSSPNYLVNNSRISILWA